MTDPPLAIALLGPVVVERDGVPVHGLGDRERCVLAVLVAGAQQPISRGALTALLWPDVPEASARLSLRVALSRLRAALPGRIRADRASASFAPAAGDDIDVHAVGPILEAAVSGGEGGPAHDSVVAALSRVRGPFAADLALARDRARADDTAFAAWLQGQRAAWDALVARAAASLEAASLEAAPTGIEILRGAARRAPLDEDLARRLMLALGRDGAHGEALDEHARLARALRLALGLTPDPVTEALRARIEAAARRGLGRRHNLPPTPPMPASSDAFVPDADVDVDVDIDIDIDRLAAWLGDPERRLISLIGPRGSGRSRLAIAASSQSVDRFLDGVLWVPADGAGATSRGIEDRFARAIEALEAFEPASGDGSGGAPGDGMAGTGTRGGPRVGSGGDADAAPTVAAWLAEREILVVVGGLDESERAAEIAAIVGWLETAREMRCLVVSEAALGVFYEHRFTVEMPTHSRRP